SPSPTRSATSTSSPTAPAATRPSTPCRTPSPSAASTPSWPSAVPRNDAGRAPRGPPGDLLPVRIFVRLLRYALRPKAPLALAFALGLLGVAVALARPWPVKVVLDNALAGQPLPPPLAELAARLPGAGSREGVLAWCVAAALLLAVVGPA